MWRAVRDPGPAHRRRHQRTDAVSEYLVNCGSFNILVIPAQRAYYLMDDSEAARRLLDDFLEGRELQTAQLCARWFRYRAEENWHDMEGTERRLGEDLPEAALVDYFVLKKYNFGSLVAVRDSLTRKVKVFKRARLPGPTDVGA
jgi:hypothetical protein